LALISSVAIQNNDKYQLILHDVITFSSAMVYGKLCIFIYNNHTYLEIEKFFLPKRPILPRLPLHPANRRQAGRMEFIDTVNNYWLYDMWYTLYSVHYYKDNVWRRVDTVPCGVQETNTCQGPLTSQ